MTDKSPRVEVMTSKEATERLWSGFEDGKVLLIASSSDAGSLATVIERRCFWGRRNHLFDAVLSPWGPIYMFPNTLRLRKWARRMQLTDLAKSFEAAKKAGKGLIIDAVTRVDKDHLAVRVRGYPEVWR